MNLCKEIKYRKELNSISGCIKGVIIILLFQQQYSPMVMRKFKKSLDSQLSQNSTASKDSEDESVIQTPLSTPRMTRRGRGGSFSGPGQNNTGELLPGEAVPSSPGLRRRRSRVPSEEDDKLINFLVAGGHDGSRERNTSLGNIGQLKGWIDIKIFQNQILIFFSAEQQVYGSLDRGLLRRSRGRKRPELLNSDLANGDRDRSAPQPTAEEIKPPPVDPKPKDFKRRVESWLKDSADDVTKADEYLEKKREIKATRGSNTDLKSGECILYLYLFIVLSTIDMCLLIGKTLGTLHEDKSLDAKNIVSKTDVISAMEAIEGASNKGPRKRTPPSHEDMKKKALIRSLGRKPSEDKLALYVRKPSADKAEDSSVKLRDKKPSSEDSKKSQFLQDMARRSLEVPTDFLDKIEEEKKSTSETNNKKYPFHRTTTPNTLREHLKENLARNLGSSTDLAETIVAIRDDEILDTFQIDSENIETPPIQRRAFRHKSFKLPEQEEDNESDIGSDFSGRRKNHKFKTISGDGRPLGDREMLLKKKRASNTDLSEGRNAATDLEDDVGIFDRFSSARKTLNRNSIRKKKDEDTVSLHDVTERKSDNSNWRNKLANRFRKSVIENDLEESERLNGHQSKEEPALRREASDYLGQQTPMTEPTRRKPFNFDDSPSDKSDKKRPSNDKSAANKMTKGGTGSVGESKLNGRKSSYIMPGDYDSELVDGKYVTSVPIINVDQTESNPASGNIRPGHSLKNLKRPVDRKNSIIDRLSKSKEGPRAASTTSINRAGNSSVYDRLANGKSGSRSNLNSSRPSLAPDSARSTSSLTRATSRAVSLPPDKPRTTLTRIKDLSKDITKNLRKGKEEGLSSSSASVIQPRNSNSLFGDRERKPMSNLNGGSNPSINSSTRSLNKSATLNATRQSQRSAENIRNVRNNVKSGATTTLPRIGSKQQPTSSKENLSRSSSSASRSSVSMSRNGSMRTGVTSPGPASSLSTSNIRAPSLSSNTLPRTKSTNLKSDKNDDIPSYMKPTAARAKKVLGTTNSDSQQNLRKTSVGRMTTSSRVTPVGPRPTRR